MRSVRRLGVALTTLALLLALLPGERTAAAQPSPTDPQLRDLALAQSELDALDAEIRGLQDQIANAIDGIDGMVESRDFLDLNRPARADALQDARTRARQMAIAAYVGIGPPLSGLDLLDAETASELSWRNSLLRHQTERLNTAAETYALLAGNADANVLALSDDINAESRQLEALNRQLSRITRKIPRAEWYVEIARIHEFADSEFARTGRREPTSEEWRKLRFCESTETYSIDTGNTFYGAYQFTWETWGTVGGSDNPAWAPPAEQDARARLLYAQRGSQPWPICGRYLP